jgi:hypothetical protein
VAGDVGVAGSGATVPDARVPWPGAGRVRGGAVAGVPQPMCADSSGLRRLVLVVVVDVEEIALLTSRRSRRWHRGDGVDLEGAVATFEVDELGRREFDASSRCELGPEGQGIIVVVFTFTIEVVICYGVASGPAAGA